MNQQYFFVCIKLSDFEIQTLWFSTILCVHIYDLDRTEPVVLTKAILYIFIACGRGDSRPAGRQLCAAAPAGNQRACLYVVLSIARPARFCSTEYRSRSPCMDWSFIWGRKHVITDARPIVRWNRSHAAPLCVCLNAPP